MNKELKEMCLVTGKVTFRVMVNMLVPKEDAQNEEHMKEMFESRGYDELDNSECEADYIDEVPVLLTKKTAGEFDYSVIHSDAWSKIVQESRNNQSKR